MFIDAFDVILLDQGRTFMFEIDRFGQDEDYASTYARVGGKNLSDSEVAHAVTLTYQTLLDAYGDRSRDNDFPTVRQAIVEAGLHVSESDFDLLDDLFAEHEIGVIPRVHRDAIHRLSETHRLGMISNIWAQPARFEHNLQKAGIFDCFEHIVWSSAYRKSKPFVELFQIALDYWKLEPERILYVEMTRSGMSGDQRLQE